MPSSSKTQNIGLNQWSGSDRPKREDFNADNQKIDGMFESGKWTPHIYGGTTAGSLEYSTQSGLYYRVGSLVHVWLSLTVSSIKTAPTGPFYIGGLPFPLDGSSESAYGSNFAVTLFSSPINSIFPGGGNFISNYIRIYQLLQPNSQMQIAGITNGHIIRGSGFYPVA